MHGTKNHDSSSLQDSKRLHFAAENSNVLENDDECHSGLVSHIAVNSNVSDKYDGCHSDVVDLAVSSYDTNVHNDTNVSQDEPICNLLIDSEVNLLMRNGILEVLKV